MAYTTQNDLLLNKLMEFYKQEGFEHRAPKKKERKIIKNESEITGKCFIDISKLTENNNDDNHAYYGAKSIPTDVINPPVPEWGPQRVNYYEACV